MRAALYSLSLALPLALLPTLLACGDKDDDTGGNEAWTPHCESSETALAWDEASPLGFSAADLAAAIGGAPTAPLTWLADGTVTELTLGVAWSDRAVFVDQWEAEPPEDVGAINDIAVICDDYLAVDATLGFATADGLLADEFAATLVAEEATAATFWLEAARADFANPAIFDPFTGGGYDEEHVALHGSLRAGGGTEGSLDFVTSGTTGDSAWQANDPVASWERDDG